MVHLLEKSSIPLQSQQLEKWDQYVRTNFQFYQNQIDKITYNLQRTQRGHFIFGSWLYPAFSQRDIQNLQIMRTKQQLGQITPEEVAQYKIINPNIAQDLNQTFNNKFRLPTSSILGTTLGLQVFAQIFNYQYSWRLAFLVGPYLLNTLYHMGNNQSAIPTLEFMNYLIQIRQSKSRLERYQSNKNSQLLEIYKSVTKSSDKSSIDIYDEIIELAKKQSNN